MTLAGLATFLDGGRLVFCVMIAIGFLRLARATGDRLYGGFAFAFVLMGVSDSMIGLHVALGAYSLVAFLPRLLAFVLIIAAIIDKNRRGVRR